MPEFLGVADGPGSFTGLRIGLTIAKTMAYATKTPLTAVNSMELLASTANRDSSCGASSQEPSELHTVIDAGRQQVYLAKCEKIEASLKLIIQSFTVDRVMLFRRANC